MNAVRPYNHGYWDVGIPIASKPLSPKHAGNYFLKPTQALQSDIVVKMGIGWHKQAKNHHTPILATGGVEDKETPN